MSYVNSTYSGGRGQLGFLGLDRLLEWGGGKVAERIRGTPGTGDYLTETPSEIGRIFRAMTPAERRTLEVAYRAAIEGNPVPWNNVTRFLFEMNGGEDLKMGGGKENRLLEVWAEIRRAVAARGGVSYAGPAPGAAGPSIWQQIIASGQSREEINRAIDAAQGRFVPQAPVAPPQEASIIPGVPAGVAKILPWVGIALLATRLLK